MHNFSFKVKCTSAWQGLYKPHLRTQQTPRPQAHVSKPLPPLFKQSWADKQAPSRPDADLQLSATAKGATNCKNDTINENKIE